MALKRSKVQHGPVGVRHGPVDKAPGCCKVALGSNPRPMTAPPKWGHPRWMNSPQEASPKFVDE